MPTYLPGPYRLIMAEIAGESDTMPTYNSGERPDRATTMDCGCDYDPDMNSIIWCPLHAAALQGVAALEGLLRVARGAQGYLEALPPAYHPDQAWGAPLLQNIEQAGAALVAGRGEGKT